MSIMRKFIGIIALAVVGITLSSCVDNSSSVEKNYIVTAATADTISKELAKADENTLVVFDCDGVLTTEKDQILKTEHRNDFNDLIEKTMGTDNKLTQQKYMSLMLKTRNTYLPNAKLPGLVSDLQKRNIKTVVLTGFAASSPIGVLTDPAQWRIGLLEKLGYRFDRSWPGLKNKSFRYFFSTSEPCYTRGVMFCADMSKSSCLGAFIKHANINPSKIIFIDDDVGHVQAIGEFCKTAGIEYCGIEYTEAKDVVSKLPYSQQIAELQFKTLKSKGIWLSDEEAQLKLNARKGPRKAGTK
jgi:FMN phosphatase YigB (HAD superfamily)